jgi:hypothetical protein
MGPRQSLASPTVLERHGRGKLGWLGREVAWIPDVPARAGRPPRARLRDRATALVFGSIFGMRGAHPMRRIG